ncbi:helix-turn-helix domain-containing protein [Lacticaseibacillus daqingensis]|uniref:helix-turn-helix domain-containing protein n=1 Tax=Lacticaseibacillus daqingensis TaxID=2486014 RepID=UPI000F7836C1|nr:helix-turn-helix transcriptional regulator [Lacticaseibacillus daqingensis]
MADDYGPTLRRLRLGRGLSQAELYADVLSPRQAIRLENGESVPRADHLETLLHRLGLSPAEFAAQRAHGATTQARLPQAIAAQAIIAKLNRWIDWELTPAELATLKAYALSASVLSIRDVLKMMLISLRFEPPARDLIRDRLWRDLQVYRDTPPFAEAATSMWLTRGFDDAVRGRVRSARAAYVTAQRENRGNNLVDVLARFYLTVLDDADGAAVARTQPIIVGLWQLGEGHLADALLDNRRHILTALGRHPQWREDELGALARLQTGVARQALRHPQTYYTEANFPGLAAALAAWGKPLQAFAAIAPSEPR